MKTEAKKGLASLGLDEAIRLRWALRDIKAKRLKFSPVDPSDLRTLIDMGYVVMQGDTPTITYSGDEEMERLVSLCVDLQQTPGRLRAFHIPVLNPNGPVSGRRLLKTDAQLCFDQFHLLTHLLPIEARMRWLSKVAPGFCEPFLQRLYISIESVRHGLTSKIQL